MMLSHSRKQESKGDLLKNEFVGIGKHAVAMVNLGIYKHFLNSATTLVEINVTMA